MIDAREGKRTVTTANVVVKMVAFQELVPQFGDGRVLLLDPFSDFKIG